MLELKNVSLSFEKGTSILKDLSLTVEKGEVFSVIGPSGAGKTVLLKLMAGLIAPTSGTRQFQGKEGISKKIAMTFQRSGLFDSLTVSQNLRFPLEEVGEIPRSEIEGRIQSILVDVGLGGLGNLFPHEMSGGMQKRLGIARALVLLPELILFDDPTAGLDPVTAQTITELISKMKDKYQMTFIIVTSNLHLAYALSDRMGFLFEGAFLEVAPGDRIRFSEHPVIHQFVHGHLEGPLTNSL